MGDGPSIDAGRVIADLRELERRTAGPLGAERVCWGEGWRRARSFLGELLSEVGLRVSWTRRGTCGPRWRDSESPPWRSAPIWTRFLKAGGSTARSA